MFFFQKTYFFKGIVLISFPSLKKLFKILTRYKINPIGHIFEYDLLFYILNKN